MISSILSVGASAGTAGAASVSAPAKSVEAFSRSMERHATDQAGASQQATGQLAAVQQAQGANGAAPAVPAVPAKPGVADTQAQSRARDALDLAGAGGHGDTILNGLQKLRGVFDKHESIVSRLMSSSVVDTRTLMAVQMEVANFTLLVDVTSKLTGKSTQAFDTLMKGQ